MELFFFLFGVSVGALLYAIRVYLLLKDYE